MNNCRQGNKNRAIILINGRGNQTRTEVKDNSNRENRERLKRQGSTPRKKDQQKNLLERAIGG